MSTEPKLSRGMQGDYVEAKWSGEDTSGIWVVGKTVLVLMDEFSGKQRGVIIPDDQLERYSMAAETGVLVAASAGAFLVNEDGTAWTGYRPKSGDRVYIEKYAGKQVKGRDGATYRIMDYTCIGATYMPEPVKEAAE